MSRKYDPQRIFNHRRTRVQQKGQTTRVKLLDEAPPRVDDQVLQKAYKLCQDYNVIPRPILVNLDIDGQLVLGYDQFFAAGSTFTAETNPPAFFKGNVFQTYDRAGGEAQYDIDTGITLRNIWNNSGVLNSISITPGAGVSNTVQIGIKFGNDSYKYYFDESSSPSNMLYQIIFMYIGDTVYLGGIKRNSQSLVQYTKVPTLVGIDQYASNENQNSVWDNNIHIYCLNVPIDAYSIIGSQIEVI